MRKRRKKVKKGNLFLKRRVTKSKKEKDRFFSSCLRGATTLVKERRRKPRFVDFFF